MNDTELYNILCPECRRQSRKNDLIDTYCNKCHKSFTLINSKEEK